MIFKRNFSLFWQLYYLGEILLLTTSSHPSLPSAVSVWCPNLLTGCLQRAESRKRESRSPGFVDGLVYQYTYIKLVMMDLFYHFILQSNCG